MPHRVGYVHRDSRHTARSCRRNGYVRAVVTTLEALSRQALRVPISRTPAQACWMMPHSPFCLHTVPAAVAPAKSLSRPTWIKLVE
ncbi:unnamed protein product (mitochondrion) [Plasmodiophora brassicae]|uniref:Uncharacterized protein n=1 Tax=Plasmodiophora brassicae TaxID=37360 RepID=A0A3P3Y854_PLABS|nr:unnamed protein product [Plasmodiophora brassicae]